MLALNNIRGATVLVWKTSIIACGWSSSKGTPRPGCGVSGSSLIPALFISKFNPPSPTISVTFLPNSGKDVKFVTSETENLYFYFLCINI